MSIEYILILIIIWKLFEIGDMMVILPRAFHMGLNLSVNICEAHNAASKDWIGIGELAVDDACYCDSQKERVKIDFKLAHGMLLILIRCPNFLLNAFIHYYISFEYCIIL